MRGKKKKKRLNEPFISAERLQHTTNSSPQLFHSFDIFRYLFISLFSSHPKQISDSAMASTS